MKEYKLPELVQEVIEGNESPLNAYAVLKKEKNQIDKLLCDIEPLAIKEACDHPDKTFIDYGCRFEYRNGSKRFKYDHIYEWREAKRLLEDIENKARQSFESMQKGLSIITDDGEFIEPASISYSKDSLIVRSIS